VETEILKLTFFINLLYTWDFLFPLYDAPHSCS